MNWFRNKKEETIVPKAKQLHQLSNDELKEKQREIKKKLNKEEREIDKQIFSIENQQKQSQQKLETEVKKGDKADKFIKQTYAKQVIQCVKNKEKYMMNKAKLQSLQYNMDAFISQTKMIKVMGDSTTIMKTINQMINIKELNQTAMELQREFEKMGMITEMIDEAIQQDDDVDCGLNEKEVDELINQVQDKVRNKEQPQQQIHQNNIPQHQQQYQPQQQQFKKQEDDDDLANRIANLG